MRVIEVAAYGGPEVLRAAERPAPDPVPGRVRVRTAATVVNPVDLYIRAGMMAPRLTGLPFPFVLGFDIAGTVLEDSEGFTAGQRVAGMVPWLELGTGEGSNAEIVSAEPGWLAPLPDGIDFTTAATIPLNALTARQSLDLLGCAPGDTVLITGASGAVGGFAVQLAAAGGARVLASASTGDEEAVGALGAAHVLGRTAPEVLVKRVRELAPEGVDAVFDAARLADSVLPAVRDGGTLLLPSGNPADLPPSERGVRTLGVNCAPNADQLRRLLAKAAAGELHSRIAEVLPAERAAEAHRRLQDGGIRGKFVLTF